MGKRFLDHKTFLPNSFNSLSTNSTQQQKMVKVVLACTSANELKGHPTGLWIEECASPYYLFLKQGYEVVLASPAGGAIPIDAGSMAEGFFTDSAKKFMHDPTAMGAFSHSIKLSSIDWSTVDAIYLAGGHGTCVDFVSSKDLKLGVETLYAANKVVAADCHGPVGLAQCVKPDGTPLVAGKTVTGFADSEEEAVQLTSIVPFLLESKFKEQGANYEKGDDWNSKVCVDGKLVTGQNPQSSDACAEAVVKLLSV
jgi:putative intracellular protease/amidase